MMVVRKDNQIKLLKDLSSSTIPFPNPTAFTASVLRRAKLSSDRIRFLAQYVSSHYLVHQNLAKGLFPAGGGIQRTLGYIAPDIRKQLKILCTTGGFTPHTFAVHPNDVRNKIKPAFLELSASAEGKALLKPINFKTIQSAANEGWDEVQALGINLLTNLIKR
jgi:phosphonate transport system substrate-binding protein